ncbi:hypothetical protein D3C72_1781810 [compost metagenome]
MVAFTACGELKVGTPSFSHLPPAASMNGDQRQTFMPEPRWPRAAQPYTFGGLFIFLTAATSSSSVFGTAMPAFSSRSRR